MNDFDDSNAFPQEDGEYTAEIGEDIDFSEDVEDYDPFREIRKLIEESELEKAQRELEGFEERGAEWYFVQAILFRKKNWFTECRRCLERAIRMDPENDTYRAELDDLDRMAEEGRLAREGKKKKKQMGADKKAAFSECCCMGSAECCTEACIGVCCELLCEAICSGCN